MCPFCGARFADAPPRPDEPDVAAPAEEESDGPLPPPRQNSHLLQLPPAPMVIMGGAPAREARRRRGVWLLAPALLIAGLVAYGVNARGVPLPAEALEPVLASDVLPCGDVPDCVLIYLAPWDAASQQTAAMLDDLRAVWADDGPVIEVVVGAGERADSLRMARAVRGSSWIDPSDSLPRALEFETVPSWFRLENGRVVRRVIGTYLPLERQLEALGLPVEPVLESGDERRVLTGEPARRPVAPPAAVDDAEDEAVDDGAEDDEAAEDEAAEDEADDDSP